MPEWLTTAGGDLSDHESNIEECKTKFFVMLYAQNRTFLCERKFPQFLMINKYILKNFANLRNFSCPDS